MTTLQDDLEAARRILAERRAELERLLGEAEEQAVVPEADPQRVGGTSRLDELQQREIASDAVRRRRRELQRVDAALERMASGEYGDCVACGAAIAPARLELDPSAILCVDCAARH